MHEVDNDNIFLMKESGMLSERWVKNMKSISTEKRLQLIRLIRDEHARNMGQLRRREEILYDIPISRRGRIPYEGTVYTGEDGERAPEGEEYVRPPSTFKMRVLISVLIGVSLFYLEIQEQQFYGISTQTVRESILEEDELHRLALEIEYLLDAESLKRNP